MYRDNIPLWATDTAGNPGSRFAIQPDGNLVVYSSSGKPIFNTGTHQGKEVTRVASPIWIRDQSLKRFPNLHFSTIQSVATGKALDAGGKNNSVYQYPSPNASNPYHQWGFHKVGDYYMIINKATGFALDAGRDGGKYPYGYVNPMTNNDYHLWKVTPNGSGYQIVSKATGRALDAGGNTENPVYMYPNPISGNSYHQWNLNLPGGGPTTQTGSSLAELDKKSRLTIDEIIQYRQLVANLPSSQRATYYRRLQYKVPYFNQRDNGYRNIADSMCNVTTLAACLTFLGIKNPQPSRQFEDVLEDIIQNYSWHGTDTNPRYWWKNFADLARKEFGVSNPGFAMMQGFPVGDVKFIENFVKENWEPSLNNGKAIMTSVSTTSYGHIVKVIDIDWQRGGIVVDDPFGKAQDSPGNSSGKSNYTNFWNTKDRNPVNTQQGQDEGGIGNDNFWSWSYCTEILGATPYLILG
ncbi:MAG: hypothetical protein HC795_10260 [Coleofasciculaceae cyanobacterium RL_1_1]|nr:hypothetical protein [Coleofasciculaceae cyanobacterium RL_1_1]